MLCSGLRKAKIANKLNKNETQRTHAHFFSTGPVTVNAHTRGLQPLPAPLRTWISMTGRTAKLNLNNLISPHPLQRSMAISKCLQHLHCFKLALCFWKMHDDVHSKLHVHDVHSKLHGIYASSRLTNTNELLCYTWETSAGTWRL